MDHRPRLQRSLLKNDYYFIISLECRVGVPSECLKHRQIRTDNYVDVDGVSREILNRQMRNS